MRNVFIVTTEQNDLARYIENELVSLPIMSGILFASAQVVEWDDPVVGWRIILHVGCVRTLESSLVHALITQKLNKDPLLEDARHQVLVHVYRGVARSL